MLVVPLAMRVTYEGTYDGRTWANVLDIVWEESDSDVRASTLPAIALFAESRWTTDIKPAVSQNVVLTGVHITDLNSDSSSSTDLTSSEVGDRSGNSFPGNVAVLASKVTAHYRTQRNGRWYQVGALEADTDATNPSTLTSSAATFFQGHFTDFFNDWTDVVVGQNIYPVVLSKNGSDIAVFPVTNFVVAGRLATQRRRQRR